MAAFLLVFAFGMLLQLPLTYLTLWRIYLKLHLKKTARKRRQHNGTVFSRNIICFDDVCIGLGFPVAFALPGSAIVTIVLAGLSGAIFEGDSGAYFIQDGPIEWLTAGVMNFRGIYWEVERDTLIAIPLSYSRECFNAPRSPKIFCDNGAIAWTHTRRTRHFRCFCWGMLAATTVSLAPLSSRWV